MNQKQIVFEHRDALDQFDAAKAKQATCARNGNCKDATYCLTCPARLEKERCQAVLADKTSTLKQLNDRIVKQNEREALQMRIDRSKERKAKKQRANNMRVGANQTMAKKTTVKPVYNRKDLTLERYLQHSKEEGKPDREIRQMYDIPSGSFTKIKKDLLAQLESTGNDSVEIAAAVEEKVPIVAVKEEIAEPSGEVALRQRLAKSMTENAIIVDQQQQTEQTIVELERQVLRANNLLTVEQQHSNDLKQMVDFLEKKLKTSEAPPQAPTASDELGRDYKTLYEQTFDELEETKKIANDRLQTIEGLKNNIAEIILSADKQTSKFRDYEILLLERLLQQLYASRD